MPRFSALAFYSYTLRQRVKRFRLFPFCGFTPLCPPRLALRFPDFRSRPLCKVVVLYSRGLCRFGFASPVAVATAARFSQGDFSRPFSQAFFACGVSQAFSPACSPWGFPGYLPALPSVGPLVPRFRPDLCQGHNCPGFYVPPGFGAITPLCGGSAPPCRIHARPFVLPPRQAHARPALVSFSSVPCTVSASMGDSTL